MIASTLYGIVFGSLIASLIIEDWNIPRRPYHAALATILLAGFVADVLRGQQ